MSSVDPLASSRSEDSTADAEIVHLVQFDNLTTILKHLISQQTELRHGLEKTKYGLLCFDLCFYLSFS